MGYYIVTVFKKRKGFVDRDIAVEFDSGIVGTIQALHFFLKMRKDSDYVYLDFIK